MTEPLSLRELFRVQRRYGRSVNLDDVTPRS